MPKLRHVEYDEEYTCDFFGSDDESYFIKVLEINGSKSLRSYHAFSITVRYVEDTSPLFRKFKSLEKHRLLDSSSPVPLLVRHDALASRLENLIKLYRA